MSRCLLIALEGWDEHIAAPLLARGLLPNLARLRARGRHGSLTPILADCPPACWASLCTGRWPDTHDVLAAVEADPAHGGARAVDSRSLLRPPLWEHAAAAGLASLRIGLPASSPARGAGACIGDAYPGRCAADGSEWLTLADDALGGFDAATCAQLDALRIDPAELDAAVLAPLMPEVGTIDPHGDRRPALAALALARSFSLHAAATWLLETRAAPLTLVCYPLLAELSAIFAAYLPPCPAAVPEQDFRRYRGVLPGAYRLADQLLGRLLELGGMDAAVLVVSTHGYLDVPGSRGHGPGLADPRPATPRPEGMWTLSVPGLCAVCEAQPATLLDLAPTVLTALGLAPPGDWPGRTLLPPMQRLRPCPPLPAVAPAAISGGANTDALVSKPADDDLPDNDALLAALAGHGFDDPLAGALLAEAAFADSRRGWNRYRIHIQRQDLRGAWQALDALCDGPLAARAALERIALLGALGRWPEAARRLTPLRPALAGGLAEALAEPWLHARALHLAADAIEAHARGDHWAARQALNKLETPLATIPCFLRMQHELDRLPAHASRPDAVPAPKPRLTRGRPKPGAGPGSSDRP